VVVGGKIIYSIGTAGALLGYLKMSLGGTSIRVAHYAP